MKSEELKKFILGALGGNSKMSYEVCRIWKNLKIGCLGKSLMIIGNETTGT
jgi:hypothetical protein